MFTPSPFVITLVFCLFQSVIEQNMHTEAMKGKRLLYLFQKDLMPGLSGAILESKRVREDDKNKKAYSMGVKFFAGAFIFGTCACMLFYVYLFSLQQSDSNQEAWFKSFLMWLFIDAVLASTLVVLVFHMLIPLLIMSDVVKIRDRLITAINDYKDAIRNKRNDFYADGGDEDTAFSLNAAKYLFVSYRMAERYPDLHESKIISRFSSHVPHKSYNHEQGGTSGYNRRYSSISQSISMVLISVIGSFAHLNVNLQDGILHTGIAALCGYSAVFVVDCYYSSPAYIIVPLVLGILVVIAFFNLPCKRKALNVELISPAPFQIPVEEDRETRDFLCNSGSDSTSMQVHLKSRRASVQHGRELIQEMRRHQSLEEKEGEERGRGIEDVVEEDADTQYTATTEKKNAENEGVKSLLWNSLIEMVEAGVDLDNFDLYDYSIKTLSTSKDSSEQVVQSSFSEVMENAERKPEVLESNVEGTMDNGEENILWKILVDMAEAGVDFDNFDFECDNAIENFLTSPEPVAYEQVVDSISMGRSMVSEERDPNVVKSSVRGAEDSEES